jgi:hypothetical protein
MHFQQPVKHEGTQLGCDFFDLIRDIFLQPDCQWLQCLLWIPKECSCKSTVTTIIFLENVTWAQQQWGYTTSHEYAFIATNIIDVLQNSTTTKSTQYDLLFGKLLLG